MFVISQLSLFSHATETEGTIGGGGIVGRGGRGGLDVGCSAVGGRVVEGGPDTGRSGSCGGGSLSPATGGEGVETETANALHFNVGFPVVPGGQVQIGRCNNVWQSALSPHIPG